jgi:hypothetical protein
MVMYRYLLTLEFTRYYTHKSKMRQSSIDQNIPLVAHLSQEAEEMLDDYSDRLRQSMGEHDVQKINHTEIINSTITPNTTDNDLLIDSPLTFCELYKKIFFLAIQATAVFFVTFLVYPGTLLATKFDMFDGNSSAKSWFNIIMITIFSTGDTLGRFLSDIWKPLGPKTVIFLTAGRIAFIVVSILIRKFT